MPTLPSQSQAEDAPVPRTSAWLPPWGRHALLNWQNGLQTLRLKWGGGGAVLVGWVGKRPQDAHGWSMSFSFCPPVPSWPFEIPLSRGLENPTSSLFLPVPGASP